MSASRTTAAPKALERRLLSDIAEIQQDPYPNVYMHFDDANIRKACIILTPEGDAPLHLTVDFRDNYPLQAPHVKVQTRVQHPNVFDDYICATMLNTDEGWTPAYTLKGIVIQLLSFFSSESLEQDHGEGYVDLAEYRREVAQYGRRNEPPFRAPDNYSCKTCGFGPGWTPSQPDAMDVDQSVATPVASSSTNTTGPRQRLSLLFGLPDEIVLQIFTELQTRDIHSFGDAFPSIKNMVNSYDFIRIRELQCFCLKQSFMNTNLGIGAAVFTGRRPVFRSEFDLLSQEAFYTHGVRKSIQGVPFDKWLPLPLSRRHWNQVRTNATACIKDIHEFAKMENHEPGYVDVLYHFMNTIVVQFSADYEKGYYSRPDSRSTLSHASEKAVEAYFGLYHLLICLATEDPSIVAGADRIISRFLTGPRSKTEFPDLGHVLVAALISTAGLTENLTFLVIKEAILHNVVWMLDTKGSGFVELAYLEPSAISEYRLTRTFAASPTSYRLLMFLKLFSSAARPAKTSLAEMRDALFDAHGAPPSGIAGEMAQRVRKIRDINGFPGFLVAMGIKESPIKSEFTAFLRRTITESVDAGYSCMPMNQSQLYVLRRAEERGVERSGEVVITPTLEKLYMEARLGARPSFFPRRGGGGGGRGGGRGGGDGGWYGRGGGGRGGHGGRSRGYGRGGRG